MTNLTLENGKAVSTYFFCCTNNASASTNMSNQLSSWVKHHGLEWTVSRLKDLKQQRIYFDTKLFKTLVSSKTNYIPRGPFGYLWSIPLEQALQTLMVYTCQFSKDITQKQMLKFVNGVTCETTDFCHSSAVDGWKETISDLPDPRFKKFLSPLSWLRSTGTRAPFLQSDNTCNTSPESSLKLMDIIKSANGTPANRRFLMQHSELFCTSLNMSKDVFQSLVYQGGAVKYGDEFYSSLEFGPVMGKIGHIQEKGMKLRSVANPFRLFQHALYPMGKYLYDILKDLPSDCTFNQEDGYKFCTESLDQGKTLYAYDLSNATDKFPLSLQVEVIEGLINRTLAVTSSSGSAQVSKVLKDSKTTSIMKQSLELIKNVSRGKWDLGKFPMSTSRKENFISWKVGQPLGLYPSFAMFALTHNVLILNIERKFEVSNTFRVLGDDVIFNNKLVADEYYKSIISFGCSISEDKSLISNDLGEFAGKLINQNGVLNFKKWQPFTMKNPLGPLHSLGSIGKVFIPNKYRKAIDLIASLPKPYGLEYNPQGIPLDLRVQAVSASLYKSPYDIVTDYSVSQDDLRDHLKEFWKSSNSGYDSYDKYNSNPKTWIPDGFIDQINPMEEIEIDHWNSVVKSSVLGDTIQFQEPKIKKLVPTRKSGRVSESGSPLSSQFKAYRNLKEVIRNQAN